MSQPVLYEDAAYLPTVTHLPNTPAPLRKSTPDSQVPLERAFLFCQIPNQPFIAQFIKASHFQSQGTQKETSAHQKLSLAIIFGGK